ncbi:hypothetical protein PF010_g5536 [Phytophthora fragariae]|uniref:Uncharacterized protein n=1 Tax=Phytophthora fragariae TaxID=53985 RepID=A0A6G0LN05_9STRA|nr:hypothetical protein PF010_g5536 [Phytophthora fragariae]KAE9245121.1 hypothetical protein PF004_g5371 [Phytophthora fragariae]
MGAAATSLCRSGLAPSSPPSPLLVVGLARRCAPAVLRGVAAGLEGAAKGKLEAAPGTPESASMPPALLGRGNTLAGSGRSGGVVTVCVVAAAVVVHVVLGGCVASRGSASRVYPMRSKQ